MSLIFASIDSGVALCRARGFRKRRGIGSELQDIHLSPCFIGFMSKSKSEADLVQFGTANAFLRAQGQFSRRARCWSQGISR